MKLKENLEISTTDFWYDLIDGGYLNPYDICASMGEAEGIDNAVQLLKEFQNSCEAQIEGFIQ